MHAGQEKLPWGLWAAALPEPPAHFCGCRHCHACDGAVCCRELRLPGQPCEQSCFPSLQWLDSKAACGALQSKHSSIDTHELMACIARH